MEGGKDGLRVAQRRDVPPALRDPLPLQVRLERARRPRLLAVRIDADVERALQPGHDAADLLEVHRPCAAQPVHDLLEPGGAALRIGRDEDVVRASLERQAALERLGGAERPEAIEHLLDGRRTSQLG